MKQTNELLKLIFLLSFILGLQGCMSPGPDSYEMKIENSYLTNDKKQAHAQEQGQISDTDEKKQNVTLLSSSESVAHGGIFEADLSTQFSTDKKLKVAVNELPLTDFIHYIFSDLLHVSYVLEPTLKSKQTPITLSLMEEVPERRLYTLVQEVLTQNQVTIKQLDGVFYFHAGGKESSKSDVAFGIGKGEQYVPRVAGNIYQLIPMDFGVSTSTRTTVRALVDLQVEVDAAQNLVTLFGKREQILRAIQVLELIDKPSLTNKSIAMYEFEFITAEFFVEQLTELLRLEGIKVTGGARESQNVFFLPVGHLGKLVVFASSDKIIERVTYWQNELDKPAVGSQQSFYIYQPKFARASDLGASLAPLLKGVSSGVNETANSQTVNAPSGNRPQQNSSGSTPSAPPSSSYDGDGIRLVVDERANSLIFYSTGQYYKELQPVIRQLDVMPRQIMMEVVIAEVKLTGSFAKGVQFAFESGSDLDKKESFSFNSKEGFNYSIVGVSGSVSVNLNQTDGLVNVLSRPTLLVRDGVAASISVGDDIPTIGSTTSDPINGDRETTTIEYRKTGIDLNVTPTVNAQGTVIMTIEQKISNVSPGSDGGTGTPAIFERTLSTEVVTGNGQTVLLGGLISHNRSNGSTSVPLLGEIPVLGHLFRSDSSSSDKTELVVLVTPRIIESQEDWQKTREDFKKGLENLSF